MAMAQQGERGSDRERRPRAHTQYDETARRRKRARPHGGYTDRSRHKQPRVALKRAIEVGARTIERVVAGRYEWRDAGLGEMEGARRRLWEGNRQWDPGD